MARTVSPVRTGIMKRKQDTQAWVIVLIVFGGLFLLTSGIVIVGAVLFGGVKQQPVNVAPVATQKVYDREELDRLVKGKTEKEVLELLGKPESTKQYADGDTTWTYAEISRDRITNKIDRFMFINFEKGIVKGSHY